MPHPPMPLPPLIAALRELARAPASEVERRGALVTSALAPLAERLELTGLHLELREADPLPDLAAGWGSPEAAISGEVMELHASSGAVIGRARAQGPQESIANAFVAIDTAVQAARAHLRADRAEEHLAALDAALRGISGALTVERVLQQIVDRVRVLGDAQYAALGIVGADGMLERFLTSGIDQAARRRIGSLPRGHGILGLLIREGRSVRIPDIEQDPRRYGFPPHHPEMHSFLGVPITVRGRSIGNLYLTNKQGRPTFSTGDQALVERFALHAGIAIENARLGEQVQQLMVIEERERIGADLHDGVIQRIYGVNLSLDDVPDLVASDPGEAARRVEQAIDGLNATIAEIREFIFILRPPGEGSGLAPSLQALAAEIRLQSGMPVDVTADDLPRISEARVRELLSVVREALSNVSRHAEATHAAVTAGTEGDVLRLEVQDDGRGFNPDTEHGAGQHGLVNMRRRAERLGGTLEVVSRSGGGTRIILTLPIPRSAVAGEGTGRA